MFNFILVDSFIILLIHFISLCLQVFNLQFQLFNALFLVSALLSEVRGSHKVFESDRIIFLRQESLSFKQVDPVESVVAPTLSDFEVGRELSHYLNGCVLLV